MNEEWRDIPGFEGLYEASSFGQIRTKAGKTTKSRRFPIRVWKQRILKQKWQNRKNSERKDARVCLWLDGKEHTRLVSRCVCSAFHPVENSAELTVNHIDGNPSNNRADNLEWVTIKENINHGFITGLFDKAMNPVVLVDRNGVQIHFVSMSAASRFVGRNKGYISNCVKNGRPIVTSDGREYDCFVEKGY